ncbi:DUF1801 domain-containing protein [Pararhodobacter aggregans]|uniref:YdhG-like domain-containing protein n=1 Tax=Pararhodobacter aggregans TaxID=404875 RepID=A0A2T7US19_9RHOB|nr:DUF1801 domain-containing protein [Pararhodobacter aggregans]PTX00411.1 uncharacterized protein DUF1801 [Pararhodobacter aggregans]PVE47388.1 hypothetical protein DDE23_11115 [Pararhodobacter aggregans]
MAELVTRPTGASVEAFLDAVEPDRRRDDGRRLDALFRRATGFQPQMWGPSIVGYGRYDYTYASGHSGSYLATGFSPRKAQLVLYILPGYADFGPILDRLGPHRKGKSCLYLTALAKVDEGALEALIRAGLADLARHWPVMAS